MPIFPYKLHPVAPRVAVLLDHETALVEEQGPAALAELAGDVRVFSDFDRVSSLLADGHGEALTWNLEPIKWRPEVTPGEWKPSPTDVRVTHVPFPERPLDALEGLVRWRDWLAAYRAAPLSSLGSSAYSLLRATLREPLWTAIGDLPPLRFTLGGRQEMGAAGVAAYRGPMRNWDLPAAYAETLAGLAYGGHWITVPPRYPYEKAAELGQLVFVRARVRIPESLHFGPLPRRPRARPSASGLDDVLVPVEYPRGVTMQGVWAWPELRQALELGCTAEKVLAVWVHATGVHDRSPFGRWWEAVQEGRDMGGFAGTLAKATGNALWGQFCISVGRRDVVRWSSGERVLRPMPSSGSRPRAYDLAEQITGAVRARMAAFMETAGAALVCVHTDGGWVTNLDSFQRMRVQHELGFRSKAAAVELELVNPQLMRYRSDARPGRDGWAYVVAGVPPRLAAETFERRWAHYRELGEVLEVAA